MTKKEETILWIAGIATVIFMAAKSFGSILKVFLPSVEGFSAVPVWDFHQWSWGYGTSAGTDPNKPPAGTITRDRAWSEAMQVITRHYNYLKPLITVNLKPQQWAALLSFSYNLGPANADNLVPNINSQNSAALAAQWRRYINAGGVPNQGLINRREKEIQLWNS